MMTDAFSGRAARAVRCDYAMEVARSGIDLPDFPSMYDLSEPLLGATAPGGLFYHAPDVP